MNQAASIQQEDFPDFKGIGPAQSVDLKNLSIASQRYNSSSSVKKGSLIG